jgi:hypothetical protein
LRVDLTATVLLLLLGLGAMGLMFAFVLACDRI